MVEVKRTVNNNIEHSKRFFLTSITDGYELLFLSDLVEGAMPEIGKIYVEQIEKQLRYVLQAPNGDKIDSFLDIKIRSEEHTSELQSLMRISYAVFCLKKQ